MENVTSQRYQPVEPKWWIVTKVDRLLSFVFQEEMEPKVLVFQNKKLAERLDHYKDTTEELRNRNEQLQQRLSVTDSEIFMINRHMKIVSSFLT